jgi:hypothetical protein
VSKQQPEKTLLNEWNQGDFTLSQLDLPWLTSDEEGPLIEAVPFVGAAVVSQTCDIVRDHVERPFVQVAALTEASTDAMAAVEARSKPRYAHLPGLKPHGLVVDLDFIATVNKTLVATWARQPGFTENGEQRRFAEALARHKQRFAFPDSFKVPLSKLRRWIERRRGQSGPAGCLVRAIEEMRARCPDWDAPSPKLDIIAVLGGDPLADERAAWGAELLRMQAEVTQFFPEAVFSIVTWDELTAREYRTTERLDFDGLSGS